MTRRIKIDSDTEVGYEFMSNKFYITNKATTTHREAAEDIKAVLDVVAKGNEVTLESIQNLVTTPETLTELFYTWSRTGDYIASIQFNDYKRHSLILDCPKKKLYFLNSNLIFDLTLNESKRDRVAYLCSYTRNTLGLEVPPQSMTLIYDFLLSFYSPKPYNVVSAEVGNKGELYYSNVFALSNFSETAKAKYYCTFNPEDKFFFKDTGSILATSSDDSTITIQEKSQELREGTKVYVTGTTVAQGSYTYTADGKYSIKSVDETGTVLTVNEPIQYSYSYAYPEAELATSKLEIISLDRELSVITLTNPVPDSVQVGDVIYIHGTTRTENYETISADGRYTVGGIEGSTITVQEGLPINYTYAEGTHPITYKKIALGKVTSISNKVVTLDKDLPVLPVSQDSIILKYRDDTWFTVASATSRTVTVQEEIPNYSPKYPKLQLMLANPSISIRVTESSNEAKLPKGEFIVDNFEQCKEYISLYPYAIPPTQEVFEAKNKPIPTEYIIDSSLPTMKLLGLYQDVYKV